MPLNSFPPLSRRRFTQWGLAAAALQAPLARAQASRKPYLADMHSHYGMFLPRLYGRDLGKHMHSTGTTLLAWAATDDHRWITATAMGWKQARQPATCSTRPPITGPAAGASDMMPLIVAIAPHALAQLDGGDHA